MLAVIFFARFQQPSKIHPTAVSKVMKQRTTVEVISARGVTRIPGDSSEVSADVTLVAGLTLV